MINQYSGDEEIPQASPVDSGTEVDKKKVMLLVGGLVVVIILLVALFSVLKGGSDTGNDRPAVDNPPIKPKIICGDGKCDTTENCANCIKDCPCKSGEECSKEKNKCIKKAQPAEEPKGPVCGDSVCDPNENCFDCRDDCKCADDEYCSPTEKICIKPVCGNSKCESSEGPYTCCIDCFCTTGEECNTETKRCEPIELEISEDRAKELIESYYQAQGETVVSMNVIGPFEWHDVPILLVEVTLEGQDWPSKVGVYESEEVTELPVP